MNIKFVYKCSTQCLLHWREMGQTKIHTYRVTDAYVQPYADMLQSHEKTLLWTFLEIK